MLFQSYIRYPKSVSKKKRCNEQLLICQALLLSCFYIPKAIYKFPFLYAPLLHRHDKDKSWRDALHKKQLPQALLLEKRHNNFKYNI